MNKEVLLNRLNKIERLVRSPRSLRIIIRFSKHLYWSLLKPFYPEKTISSNIFFGSKINFPYPSCKDIFLWEAKSHDSELRLSKFMISNLSEGSSFLDIGAHVGYFTLLAHKLVGTRGHVISIEATKNTFSFLEKNTSAYQNIEIYNKAASDVRETIPFYEFPTRYSEYNSSDVEQFKEEEWFKNHPPIQRHIKSIPLDDLVDSRTIDFIKIDVEGWEEKVLKGLKSTIVNNPSILIAMEFLNSDRSNEAHLNAVKYLAELGFNAYSIDKDGNLKRLSNIEQYQAQLDSQSDNLIFKSDKTK